MTIRTIQVQGELGRWSVLLRTPSLRPATVVEEEGDQLLRRPEILARQRLQDVPNAGKSWVRLFPPTLLDERIKGHSQRARDAKAGIERRAPLAALERADEVGAEAGLGREGLEG